MTLTAILGWTATFLFTICYVPQIIKTAKTKTVEGLSFALLIIQFVANIIALWYATRLGQAPLEIKYVLGIVFLFICIGLYVRVLQHNKRTSEQRANATE